MHSTRVSNELGAGHPKAARLAICVVVALAVTEGLIVGATMTLARNLWGHAYSDEDEVVKYVAIMMPILAISNFVDGIQAVLAGKQTSKLQKKFFSRKFSYTFLLSSLLFLKSFDFAN